MATASQIKKIHALKNILGLDDELYREMLISFGVCSSKELTGTKAILFIEILENKVGDDSKWVKHSKKYEELNRDNKMASEAQLRMIEGLWREICYFDNDKFAKKSLRKFLKAKHKVDDVMFLTRKKASKVIQAIMAMKRNIKKSAATL